MAIIINQDIPNVAPVIEMRRGNALEMLKAGEEKN